MAQTSFPESDYNSGALTEAEWERVAARYTDDGIDGNPSQSAVVTAGAGLQVVIAANKSAIVRGFRWETDATTYTHTIDANSSGQTRADWVCLRLDRSTWEVRTAVKAGTPGMGSPSLLRQDSSAGGTVWEVPLALVTVANGASSVTVRRYEEYIGSRCKPCTSITRPAFPRVGDQIFEIDTGNWLGWNGTDWGDVLYSDSGVVDCSVIISGWSNNVDTVLQRRSGSVHLRLGAFTRTGSSIGGGTDVRLPVSIPSAYRHPNRDIHVGIYVAGSGAGGGRATIYAANNANNRAGQIWLTNHTGVQNDSSVTGFTASWVAD